MGSFFLLFYYSVVGKWLFSGRLCRLKPSLTCTLSRHDDVRHSFTCTLSRHDDVRHSLAAFGFIDFFGWKPILLVTRDGVSGFDGLKEHLPGRQYTICSVLPSRQPIALVINIRRLCPRLLKVLPSRQISTNLSQLVTLPNDQPNN